MVVGNHIGSLSVFTAAAAAPQGLVEGVLLNRARAMNNKVGMLALNLIVVCVWAGCGVLGGHGQQCSMSELLLCGSWGRCGCRCWVLVVNSGRGARSTGWGAGVSFDSLL
jgi:hypothetical protein